MALIRLKRGVKARLPVLAVGEMGYCEDTHELYIGTQAGNKLINNEGGGSGGGASDEGINQETLTGDKTLTKDDVRYQFFALAAYNHFNLYLPMDAPAGKVFTLTKITAEGSYIQVYQDTAYFDQITNGAYKTYIFDGINWILMDSLVIGQKAFADTDGVAMGNSASAQYGCIAIGSPAYASMSGVALGKDSSAHLNSVAIGNSASSEQGVALGPSASACPGSVALGSSAKTLAGGGSIAKGRYSEATRWGEEAKSIDGYNNKYSYSTFGWCGITSGKAPTEFFLSGITNQRATISTGSIFGFSIYVTAVDTNMNNVKRWRIDGVLKSTTEGAVTLEGVDKTVILNPGSVSWDVGVSVDTVNKALKLVGAGEDGLQIRWVARGEIEEVKL